LILQQPKFGVIKSVRCVDFSKHSFRKCYFLSAQLTASTSSKARRLSGSKLILYALELPWCPKFEDPC